MWTYIARRLLYAIPILIGVLFLTFMLFFAISSPEDMARTQLQKGAKDDTIARWMRDKGYATYNEQGLEKLRRAPELEALSRQQSQKGEDKRQLEAKVKPLAEAYKPVAEQLAPAKLKGLTDALKALGTDKAAEAAAKAITDLKGDTRGAKLRPILVELKKDLAARENPTPQVTGAIAAVDALDAATPSDSLQAVLEGMKELPAAKALKVAEDALAVAAKPHDDVEAEMKAVGEEYAPKIKAAGDKKTGNLIEKKRLEVELARKMDDFAARLAPLANDKTRAELAVQEAKLAADRERLAALRALTDPPKLEDGSTDPVYAVVISDLAARTDIPEGSDSSHDALLLAIEKAGFEQHLLSDQVGALIITAKDTQRHGIIKMFVTYVVDLFTFNFGENNFKRPVGEVLRNGMGPSLKLMIPAFLLTEFLAVTLALFAALYRGTKVDRSMVVLSVLLMSVSAIALTMIIQKVLAADWGYFPIAGYTEGFAGYAFLILPMMIYVVISLGPQVRFNRILMLDEVGLDYVRTAKAKGLSQNVILFKHVLRNAMIPLITRWAVIIPNLYLGSLVLESFFGIPGLGGITVQAIANRDVNTIRALVFIGTIIYILATLAADVLYAVVDPRVKLK